MTKHEANKTIDRMVKEDFMVIEKNGISITRTPDATAKYEIYMNPKFKGNVARVAKLALIIDWKAS